MDAETGLLSCCWSYSFFLGVFHVHEVCMLINFFFSLSFYYRVQTGVRWVEGILPLPHTGAPKPWGGVHPVLGAVVAPPNSHLEAVSPPGFWWPSRKSRTLKSKSCCRQEPIRFSTGSETVGSQLGKDGETFPARKVADSWLD